MADNDDFLRTIIYGEAALKHIRRCEIAAFPRHYELWYTYSSGFNSDLNEEINHILRTRDKLTLEEVSAIYDRFLSPYRLGDRMDELGADLNEQIDYLIRSLNEGADANRDYGSKLEHIGKDIADAADQNKLTLVVQKLAAATVSAREQYRSLEQEFRFAKHRIETLKDNLESARFESLMDDLTALGNRKHFDLAFSQTLAAAQASGETFSLLVLDIDNYKRFNDQFGHQTGDQVLRLVAMTLKSLTKGRDIATRYGGDEFAVVLPGTNLHDAKIVANHLRRAVQKKELKKRSTGQNLGNITISIGVGEMQPDDTEQSLFDRADAALYAAKSAGRNCVRSQKDINSGDRIAS